MWKIIDAFRKWMREHRELSYWEREDLVVEWYDLWYELTVIFRNNKDAWYAEWGRLVLENRPRPYCIEQFYAQKMDRLAKKAACGGRLYVSVMKDSGVGNIRIVGKSLKCMDITIGSAQMTI